MDNTPSLKQFNIDKKTILAFSPPWPDPVHQFHRDEAVAIIAALLAGRPLLIEGPPGSGKSQIAAAAAMVLNRKLIPFVVNTTTEPEELLWRYDALQRLNDAQANSINKKEGAYLSKGPLWIAFEEGGELDIDSAVKPYIPRGSDSEGKVVLIDEIDKADRSVPNALLEVFGNRRFKCPHIESDIGVPAKGQAAEPPLVIITSNREQQLPPAFVRRCLVLRIGMPDAGQLAQRGEMHFGDKLTSQQYQNIADVLWDIRENSGLPDELQPGQAEYLDLVRAITGALDRELTDQHNEPITFDQLLEDMQRLAFNKSGLER